jgi:zinc resistance-associated protein
MWKTVLAGTTALAIAGATFAYADQGPGKAERAQRWRPNAADITAFADARIAALKAGLELNAEQQKNWPAVESALRDMAKQRADRFAARQNAQTPADPIARLNRRAEAMEQRGAALKKLATAAGPLYQSLNDAQKHRFVVLARLAGSRFGHWHGRHEWRDHDGWRGHDGWRHHGPRGPERGPGPQ